MPLLASVVIPTYNRSELLSRCLRSLFHQTADPATYELVVVDDGSTDETPDMMKKLTAEAPCRLQYLWHENTGRSRNRNIGITAAQGRYIILLDCDMVVQPQFIEAHLRVHTHPKLIVHGSMVNTPVLIDPATGPKQVRDLSRAFFATGNVSVERQYLITAGLFDEDFIEYGWEDLELGERLRHLGLRAVKSPCAVSFHFDPPFTFHSIPGMIRKEHERGHTAVLFLRKNPSLAVRLMTLISPAFFLFDRFLTPGHWPERPGTMKLLERLEQSGRKFLFNFLVTIIKNHAYADGLREALAQQKKA